MYFSRVTCTWYPKMGCRHCTVTVPILPNELKWEEEMNSIGSNNLNHINSIRRHKLVN